MPIRGLKSPFLHRAVNTRAWLGRAARCNNGLFMPRIGVT
ncbi:hypothetical protein TSAR_016885 [Trichomalopsis sarcophagae]|uniref:Uncharacterized protein n=1 Tax=Trichomalopsis sarcophagae TaxID=543379 RepID=A0A232EYR6_9HYME|nr:hypothetical protein TSAR_016885 [Trichomalopsis sarcophagae]